MTSSPSYFEFTVPTSEFARDLAVSALERNELDLDRNVSPSNEVAAGDDGTLTESKELSVVAKGLGVITSASGFAKSW